MMSRAPTLILGAAGVLMTTGLTAFVSMGGSVGASVALGLGTLTAAIGLVLSTRWAKARLLFLRTFAMDLSRERDACLDLRSELRRQKKRGELKPWADWHARIVAWDDAFWRLLESRLPDLWRIHRRENAVILNDYGDRWAIEMLDLLEGRWQLIKRLSEREHEGS